MTFAFPKPIRHRSRVVLEETRKVPCIICRRPAEACHIRSRGAGGDDSPENLLSMCVGHHREQHRRGWKWMSWEYPEVADALKQKGWEYNEAMDRWWNPKLRGGDV